MYKRRGEGSKRIRQGAFVKLGTITKKVNFREEFRI